MRSPKRASLPLELLHAALPPSSGPGCRRQGGQPTLTRALDAPSGDVIIEGGNFTVQDGQAAIAISVVAGKLTITNATIDANTQSVAAAATGIRTFQEFSGRGLKVTARSGTSATGLLFNAPANLSSSSVFASGGSNSSIGISMSSGASTVRIMDVSSEADNGIAYGFLAPRILAILPSFSIRTCKATPIRFGG